jgi:hypothetical protein
MEFKNTTVDRLGNIIPAVSFNKNFTASRAGGFLSYIWTPLDCVSLTAGLRGDYYTTNRKFHLSQRFSIGWQVTDRFSLNASAGIFYQSLPSVILSQNESNRNLREPSSIHAVAGLEYVLTSDAKFSVEVYNKKYRELAAVGKTYARGIEFLLQKKLAKDFYGLMSFSLFRARYQDYNGQWRDRVYDNRYIFCVIGGYRPMYGNSAYAGTSRAAFHIRRLILHNPHWSVRELSISQGSTATGIPTIIR